MNNNGHFAHKICAGIDKLSVTTRNFSVQNAGKIPKFTLKPHHTDLSKIDKIDSILFKDKTGKEIFGQSAYLNNHYYTLNINSRGLQLIFNPSKTYHAYNLCADQRALKKRVQQVLNEIELLGITADWNESTVTRTDLAQNAIMKEPIIAYNQIYGLLQVPYANKSAHYYEGFTSGNNQFCINIYNKGKEMRGRNIEVVEHDNLMRLEMQFKTSKAVGKRLELHSLRDLLNDGVESLQAAFKRILVTDIFRTDPKLIQKKGKSYDDHLALLQKLKARYPKKALSMHIELYGVQNLIIDFGGIEPYLQLLKDAGYHRNSPRNQIKRIRELMNLNIYQKDNMGLSKLYAEMHKKFAS